MKKPIAALAISVLLSALGLGAVLRLLYEVVDPFGMQIAAESIPEVIAGDLPLPLGRIGS